MKPRVKVLAAALGTCGVLGLFSLLTAGEPPGAGQRVRGLGSVQVLQKAFREWEAAKMERGGEGKLVLGLGWSKAFSAEHTPARGVLTLDLAGGQAYAEIEGLADPRGADLWLVDNRPGSGRSDLPERGDGLLLLGRVRPQGEGNARLETRLDPGTFRSFEVDLAVVTRPGDDPARPALLYGHTSLFQKLHVRSRIAPPSPVVEPKLLRSGALAPPRAARAASTQQALAALVELGEDLFFNETFDGNGRTCGTCHPAENNFTIDPRFIAKLPPNDPLFVAEHEPALAELERPQLLRRLGLIVVNADGFEDPAHKFVLRSVSHTLALRTSMEPSPVIPGTGIRFDLTTVPPIQRTGWSGDGSPGSGTLLEFSLGAVTQHNPRTLARVPGVDFRVPTTEELEALEAFQLALGRQSDPIPRRLKLKDPGAAAGNTMFNNTIPALGVAAKCAQCHADAGANGIILLPPNPPFKFNGTFDTGVENMPDQPARRLDPTLPFDGGFGTAEACDLDRDGSPDPGVFGNCSFNVQPVIEAADTGPFFHNNSAATLEEAIAFYSTDAFNNTAPAKAILGIRLTAEDNAKLAAFIRVMGALENIRHAQERQQGSLTAPTQQRARHLLALAAIDSEDAAEVLAASRLHPDAVARLWVASLLLQLAADGAVPVEVAVEKATLIQAKARSLLVEE